MKISRLPIKFIPAAAITICAAILFSMAAFSSNAFAGEAEVVSTLKSGTVKMSYLPGNPNQNIINYYSLDGKVTKAKSSRKSIATVSAKSVDEWGYTYHYLQVKLKKAGTTKISFKVGRKKYSATLKVYKYASPIKSLKIGGREFAKNLTAKKLWRGVQCYGTDVDLPKVQGKKVKVKAKSGWKLNKIYYKKYVKNIGKPGLKLIKKTFKNGGTIKTGYTPQFYIELKNKKTGLIENIIVGPDFEKYGSQ